MLKRMFGGKKTPTEWFESARKRYEALKQDQVRLTEQWTQRSRAGGGGGPILNQLSAIRARVFPAILADLDKALAAQPNFVEAWFNKGCLYSETGDPGGAIHCFKMALDCHPAHAGSLYMLGRLFYLQNDVQPAIDCLRRAVSANPQDGDAWYELSMALRAAGETASADEAQARATLLRPDLRPNPMGVIVYVAHSRLFT